MAVAALVFLAALLIPSSQVRAGIAGDYDANGNELIDLNEAIAAVADYNAGIITREQATAIVKLYYGNEGSAS